MYKDSKRALLPHSGFVCLPPQWWARVHWTPCTPHCYVTGLDITGLVQALTIKINTKIWKECIACNNNLYKLTAAGQCQWPAWHQDEQLGVASIATTQTPYQPYIGWAPLAEQHVLFLTGSVLHHLQQHEKSGLMNTSICKNAEDRQRNRPSQYT